MTNEKRYKDALEEIARMNVGPITNEIIRRALHPKETCPQCNGAGEVPQIRTPDCGDCESYSSTGPWSGECHKGHKISDETDSVCYSDFVNRRPMQTCPSCNGRSKDYEEEKTVPVQTHHHHDFFEHIDID